MQFYKIRKFSGTDSLIASFLELKPSLVGCVNETQERGKNDTQRRYDFIKDKHRNKWKYFKQLTQSGSLLIKNVKILANYIQSLIQDVIMPSHDDDTLSLGFKTSIYLMNIELNRNLFIPIEEDQHASLFAFVRRRDIRKFCTTIRQPAVKSFSSNRNKRSSPPLKVTFSLVWLANFCFLAREIFMQWKAFRIHEKCLPGLFHLDYRPSVDQWVYLFCCCPDRKMEIPDRFCRRENKIFPSPTLKVFCRLETRIHSHNSQCR